MIALSHRTEAVCIYFTVADALCSASTSSSFLFALRHRQSGHQFKKKYLVKLSW